MIRTVYITEKTGLRKQCRLDMSAELGSITAWLALIINVFV